jgi:outer membrane lipopolysaccharide assembly protein LptE/RlpB
MRNRSFSHLLISILLCLSLGACGFHLRTAEQESLGFKTLQFECNSNTSWALCENLERELSARGVTFSEDAQLTLQVNDIKSSERVFTINQDASADEYELTHEATFTLEDSENVDARYENTISARRIYRHNSSALLAKDREQEAISKALDVSLSREIIRQLTLIKIQE